MCIQAQLGLQGAAAGDSSRQRMMTNLVQGITRQEAEAVPCERLEITIDRSLPVRKSGAAREIFHLVELLRAQAAGIAFLKRHHVVVGRQLGDTVEVGTDPARRQDVTPHPGEVVPVVFGLHAHLDVQREHAQPALRRTFVPRLFVVMEHRPDYAVLRVVII